MYFAFYIGDFRFTGEGIGDFQFWYNEDRKVFEMAKDPDFAYSLETVCSDEDFLLFERVEVEWEEGEQEGDRYAIVHLDKSEFYQQNKG